MLTLARALGRKPRLLLADELSLGLAPLVVDRLLQAVRAAADEQGTAVIMVEQHAHKALNYTDHAIVMRRGRVGLDLTGEDARTRIGEVEQAYLTSAGGDVAAGEADLAAAAGTTPRAEPTASRGAALRAPLAPDRPGVSWRPGQAVAATRRPGREAGCRWKTAQGRARSRTRRDGSTSGPGTSWSACASPIAADKWPVVPA